MDSKKILNSLKKKYSAETYELDSNYDYKEVFGITGYISNEDLRLSLRDKIFFKDYNVIKFINSCGDTFSYDRYLEYREYKKDNIKDSSSMKFHKLKYGEKGEYYKKLKDDKCTMTPDKDGYEEWKKSCAPTIENMGEKKYKQFCERNKGNHSLERKIELYGEVEGNKKFNESQEKLKRKNTLPYYIELYGEKEGTEKYNSKNNKNSKSSKEFALKQEDGFFDHGSEEYWYNRDGENGLKKRTEYFKKISNTLNDRTDDEKEEWKENIRNTMEENGHWAPLEEQNEVDVYRNKVWAVTRKQDISTLKNYKKRGNHAYDEDVYHLDHKISVMYGFLNNIEPEIIGDIDNLQMLKWDENISKGSNCYSLIN